MKNSAILFLGFVLEDNGGVHSFLCCIWVFISFLFVAMQKEKKRNQRKEKRTLRYIRAAAPNPA